MLFRISRRVAALALQGVPMSLAVAGLVACGSTKAPQRPVAAVPAAKPAASAPRDTDSSAAALPTGLAARFADPAVIYRTPALLENRPGFTTQAELQAAFQQLAGAREQGAADSAPFVSTIALGNSQAGVPLEALLLTRSADPKPAALLKSGRPTVLLVGQVHGDEPAGAEALLVLAQELAGGRLQSVLERINVVILPRANPDGALKQQAATANGTDLDRDLLLLATPEARAQARLLRDFQPVVVVDAREYAVQKRYVEKFGAAQGEDALLQYATALNQSEFITKASEEWFRKAMLDGLKAEGLRADWHHRTSASATDKKVSMGGVLPDNARNLHGLRNIVSLTIESRGAGLGRQHLKRRVHTQVTLLTSVLQTAAARSADLVKLRKYVDAVVRSQACNGQMQVDAALTSGEHSLQMFDPQTGAPKPVTVKWESALAVRDLKTRARPCGYWLAADQGDAVARLRGLGVRVEQFSELAEIKAEVNGAPGGKGKAKSDKPAVPVATGGKPEAAERPGSLFDAPKGSYFVPLSQPLGNLVAAALEAGPNGYLANKAIGAADRVAKIVVLPKAKRVLVP